jgi:hypothetical protein
VAGLLEQNPAAPNDQCVHFDELLRFGSRFPYGDCSRILCATKRFHRAHFAFRLPRYANECAKIEECRVENRSVGFWKKARCILPKRSAAQVGIDWFTQIGKPRQNPGRVRFDNWDRLIECESGYGVRRVFPDPWEFAHLLDCTREAPAASIHNHRCCGVEISRARVIAEALPCAEHVIFAGARQ